MTQPEYEHKKRECWEEFTTMPLYKAFNYAFDRAYALGREKETIMQGQIEKAAKEHADELRVSSAIPGALVPMLHDIAKSSYLQGAQDFIGKQEKDAETVICGWVARDMDGEIFLYENKPERGYNEWLGGISSEFDFQKLKWSSDPIEVELTIKRKKK